MAQLHCPSTDQGCLVFAEHLVGRAVACTLRLSANYVSGQHALIRWSGCGWEIVDRGSRNGTRLNDALLEPRRAYALRRGDRLAFGHAQELWILQDDAPPEPMVLDLSTGKALSSRSGVIGVPGRGIGACTLFQDVDGSWKLEDADGATSAIADGMEFTHEGATYLFRAPVSIVATASLTSEERAIQARLSLAVSTDEEFVQAWLDYGTRRVELGARSHNYLLLVLARARVADRAALLADSECGWIDKDMLARGLLMTPQQIDGEVFRVRKHLAQLRLPEAATAIERRPGTRQLRIGFSELNITSAARERK